ncbi:MAG: Na/Pi symporter, partial [Erysipelotrichaceae bacterium]|nr:Na/Pi symporter [Erysipelotrichaceae bacterium]
MDLLNIIRLVGGLALFLFGMNVMGDALAKLAGGKLEKILEKLTSRRIYAILLGALVTAIIQSSSATTVMVVGFVNSGIMSLNQAVGIIIGANIGTTMTSWILSLVGLQGESLLMSLLKPVSLS